MHGPKSEKVGINWIYLMEINSDSYMFLLCSHSSVSVMQHIKKVESLKVLPLCNVLSHDTIGYQSVKHCGCCFVPFFL